MERKEEKKDDKKKLEDEDDPDSDDETTKAEGADQQVDLKTKVKQAAFIKSGVKKQPLKQ